MIDFLVMELLRRLVLAALRTLLAQVKASSMQGIKLGLIYDSFIVK